MGKNAKRRKEAKLQEKLKRLAPAGGCCDHEGHCHHDHSSVMASEIPRSSASVLTAGKEEVK